MEAQSKIQKVNEAITFTHRSIELFKTVKGHVEERRDRQKYTIRIEDDGSNLWDTLNSWVIEKLSRDKIRKTTARQWGQKLLIFSDVDMSEYIDIDGHEIKISIAGPGSANNDGQVKGGDDIFEKLQSLSGKTKRSVLFTATSREAINAVENTLKELVAIAYQRPPRLYIANGWGSWSSRGEATKRNLDSIILRSGVKESLVEDLHRFLNSEKLYNELGIPWHRGYLFHGPPGTGKTSMASVLASQVKGNIYSLSLQSVKSDNDLNGLISDMSLADDDPTVLIIEDIDTVHGATSRQVDEGVSMGGLLNVLDGIITPSGLITIMTTNHLEELDDALTRPGRADMLIEVGYLNEDQFFDLCKRFMGEKTAMELLHLGVNEDMKITPADVVDKVKIHLENPSDAYDDIVKMIKDKMDD